MNDNTKCLKCGGSNLTLGSVQGNGRSCFRANYVPFFNLRVAEIPLDAKACLDCGFVELITNKEKLMRVTKKGKKVSASSFITSQS